MVIKDGDIRKISEVDTCLIKRVPSRERSLVEKVLPFGDYTGERYF